MKYIFIDNKVDFKNGLFYLDYAYIDEDKKTQTKWECFETVKEANERYKQISEMVESKKNFLPAGNW